MGLASLPGKLAEYVDLEREGLTAIELDVKDENGQIGFNASSLKLAARSGRPATSTTREPPPSSSIDRGLYLIGRIVTFEDPVLSHGRTDLAVRRSDGSVWEDSAGLGWTNPYDRRVWEYNVDVADRRREGRVRRDHVRLRAVPVRRRRRRRRVLQSTGEHARRTMRCRRSCATPRNRLEPLGVRVSAARVRALGDARHGHRPDPAKDGPAPRRRVRDDLPVPVRLRRARPGRSRRVAGSHRRAGARRFNRALEGRDALLLPWVQDFSFTTPYGVDEVRAQIYSARLAGAKGYLIWNASGVYTDGTLTPP